MSDPDDAEFIEPGDGEATAERLEKEPLCVSLRSTTLRRRSVGGGSPASASCGLCA